MTPTDSAEKVVAELRARQRAHVGMHGNYYQYTGVDGLLDQRAADLIAHQAARLEEVTGKIDALDQERDGFAQLCAKLKSDNKDMGATFDARWGATQRAIKRWQSANPGNDLTWPDHADLVVWCLDQLAAVEARSTALEQGLRWLLDVVERQPRIAKLLPEDGSPLAVARAALSEKEQGA